MSSFKHGNNRTRFDLHSFYAHIIKSKLVELLDADGNTPFDSDTIDNSVFDYAAQLYADIQNTGILSYFDSDNFRQDSDGSGSNDWNSISRNQAEAKVYRPLRRFMYALDSDEGIDNTANTITSGFERKYYTLPLSDSEGALRHVSILSFLKSHFNRWISYDSFERYKLTSRVVDLMNEDSDVRYRFADNFLVSVEEDSDLARRVVEFYSNVLQTDSEVRNEVILTAVTALTGLTPGGDSDAAEDLAIIINNVLNNMSDSDSDIRTKFGWQFIYSLKRDSDNQDSDLQNRLRAVISNTELTYLETPLYKTRELVPMDGDDTGSIGDSENRWSLGNFTTLTTDVLKDRSLSKDRIVYVSDSEGKLNTHSGLQLDGDANPYISRLDVSTDANLFSVEIQDLDYEGVVHTGRDSDGRQITNTEVRYNDSDGLILSGRNQMAYDSDRWWDYVLENIGVFTIDSEDVRDIMRETHVLSENTFPIGQRGNVYFVDSDQSNKLATKDLIYVSSKIVDTERELNRALGDVTTKQEIFNTWYRFSHQYNSGATPGTFTYPASASDASNANWQYDSGTDTIYTTVNTTTYSGFVSSDTYDDYTLHNTLNAPFTGYSNGDDDTISTIVGFVTEGVKGQAGYREHTLQFIRTAGGFPMTDQNYGNVTWALVYNYNQDDVRLLVDGTNLGTASTGITIGGSAWSDFANGTRVEIRRKGDIVRAYCSQMNTTTIDSDTEIEFDLSSDSDTLKFRGPVRYGYGAHSQQGSYWDNTFFAPDIGSFLHDLHSTKDGLKYRNDEGGNVYEYDLDNGVWEMDSDLTVDGTIGQSRIAHNELTGKTFFVNDDTNLVNQVMTSRKFSDVMALPPLTAEPDSEILGKFGLRPGTIACADGVNWDPKSKGGSTPYFVFYQNDSDTWREMVTS